MKKKELYEIIHKEYLKHDSLCMLYEFGHIVIDGLLYRAYAPSKYLANDKKKYVYFQNPKVAASSIKASIYEENVNDDGSIHTIMEKKMSRRWKKKWDSYYKFVFVRNPFERIYSCYENKYHDPSKWIGQKQPFKYYLFGYLSRDNGFDEFVKKACKIPDCLMDQHLKPQYLLIYKKDKINVDFVGKYETLNEDFENVRKKFGFKKLPHLNQSKRRNWMDSYTLELAEIVYERYKEDFLRLDYDYEYEELISYLKQKEA